MNELKDLTEDALPKKLKFINCPKCKIMDLTLIYDLKGKYYQCPHCKWDSLGLFKTKDKFVE